ncbi:MAG: ester cyclase [Candidatus Binatia bacterium]
MADTLELARRHDEAFNSQDAEARKSLESPDVEVVMPGGMTLRGPEQVIQVVQAFWAALPDGKIVLENQFAAGDVVVAEGNLVGTHSGPFRSPAGEVPPSGNKVTLRYATVKTFGGGKLVSEHLYFDQLEFLQQIGAMPS